MSNIQRVLFDDDWIRELMGQEPTSEMQCILNGFRQYVANNIFSVFADTAEIRRARTWSDSDSNSSSSSDSDSDSSSSSLSDLNSNVEIETIINTAVNQSNYLLDYIYDDSFALSRNRQHQQSTIRRPPTPILQTPPSTPPHQVIGTPDSPPTLIKHGKKRRGTPKQNNLPKKQKKEVKDFYGEQCAICLEEISEKTLKSLGGVKILKNCQHAFHRSCICKWRNTDSRQEHKLKCPICRSSY